MAALNHAKIINALEEIAGKAAAEVAENFIFDFLHAYGTSKATLRRLQAGDRQRNIATIPGDLAMAQKLYWRPVRAGESVAAALEGVRALSLLQQHKIRFVLVTDFITVAAYDCKVDDATTFDFCDLKTNYEFFLPLTGKYEKAVEYAEHPADVKACEKMGRLYDSIRNINHYEKDDLHTLNVFLTRLLFCFFAEDTGIFPIKNQMSNAIQALTLEDGSDMDEFFSTFFTVLNLPDTAPERKAYSATLQAFPYVNGGLFSEQVPVPQFNTKARRLLLECGSMTWGEISPVIFGSMFQAVMDPERRRSMGAHYTSEKNILKVVRPLFLDALHAEFAQILELKRGKLKALKEFHTKLGSLGFLDPACGCGNFLVVSYRELRELELLVVQALQEKEPKGQALDVKFLSKVNINQFYGIELEEFPVEIARVSLWLMEHVMNVKFGKALGQVIPSIPLHHSAEIVCANALTLPWESVVAPEKLSYILGNPPFAGAYQMNSEQKEDIEKVFHDIPSSGVLDYVTAWYRLAVDFIQNTDIEVAFVSTNSICQGEQVGTLWIDLALRGCVINFAHQTFQWKNEAKNNAGVYCIIIGFACFERARKEIFTYKKVNSEPETSLASSINPYLAEGAMLAVFPASCSLSAQRPMVYGNKPTDGGNLIIEEADYERFIRNQPEAKPYIKKLIGSKEFLHSKRRYCLWLVDAPQAVLCLPKVAARIAGCREMRLKSRKESTKKSARTPHLFQEIRSKTIPKTTLVTPRVSSERRPYIPIGFMGKDTVATDLVNIVPDGDIYDFGILTSAMHMTWTRTVCGRLKSDFRYSCDLCYNTFPWPTVTPQQTKAIEALADTVLMTREMYPDMTLAQMYDPDKMPAPLREAHAALDVAVDRLYRAKPFENDEQRLQLLFELYEKLVSQRPQNDAAPAEYIPEDSEENEESDA